MNDDGNKPLIIVDDVQYTYEQLSQINVNEIESISILKDASTTAIYGSRGANGVVLITTKHGKEGKIKMVSFMRDTLVNIKGASETDYSQDLKLNTAFNIGEQNNHQGAELMRETLKRNFDIDIKYYAMVDFETFATGVDTLFPNGVEINAKFATIDGKKVSSVQVPDDLKMDKNGHVPNQTIKVGKQAMDGRTLLNYARFRKDDEGDYGRTKRQQQVMQAVMKQLKNPLSLFKGPEALGKVYSLTSTNMSMTDMLDLGLSNAGSFKKGINSQTIPSDGDWIDSYDLYGGQGIEIDFDTYQAKLKELGFEITLHDKMPDVVLYRADKNWIYFVESVTSVGPMDPKRILEITEMTKDVTAGKIFVTAFLDFKTYKKFAEELAWETEVWIADMPDHMIHLNGDKFLGPRI